MLLTLLRIKAWNQFENYWTIAIFSCCLILRSKKRSSQENTCQLMKSDHQKRWKLGVWIDHMIFCWSIIIINQSMILDLVQLTHLRAKTWLIEKKEDSCCDRYQVNIHLIRPQVTCTPDFERVKKNYCTTHLRPPWSVLLALSSSDDPDFWALKSGTKVQVICGRKR